MFTKHSAVDILHTDREILGQTGTKTRRIEKTTGTDNLICRKARTFAKNIGQNVNRIADHDIDGIGSHAGNLGNDALGNVHVDLGQIQTGLAGASGHTGGNDHDIGALGILVITGIDVGRGNIRCTLTDIHCLAEGLLFIDVDQHDLRGIAADGKGIRNR